MRQIHKPKAPNENFLSNDGSLSYIVLCVGFFLNMCVGPTNAVRYYKMVRPFSTTGLENCNCHLKIAKIQMLPSRL